MSPVAAKEVEVQKAHNACKICWIKVVAQYDWLQMVTNNPTKFERNPSSGFQEVC